MRKILISIVGALVFCTAFAAGENIPTSKSYVDAGVAEKQDKISANNGAAQVLTNTGTAGEYGTKGIYDANGEYAAQQNNLVDAATMNAGVQNAIDSEFQCVEYNPNDPTDCWLMDVFGETAKRSPNLFNKDDSRIIRGKWLKFTTDKIGQNFYSMFPYVTSSEQLISGPITIQPNHTYTISNYSDSQYTMANPSFFFLDENFIVIDGFTNAGRNIRTFTVPDNNNIKYLITPGHVSMLDTIQLEEGTTATSYQPYGNIYVPSGN